MRQLRRDPIHGHWSVIAPGRSQRPVDYQRAVELAPLYPCPFCPGNESLTPPELDSVRPTNSAPNEAGWVVRLVPNRYAALSVDEGEGTWQADPSELHRAQPALGRQEIVIATPDHHRRAAHFSMDHWDTVLAACQYRMEQMIADRRIKFVLLFENHGEAAGASRAHAHFQIMGLPVMPLALTHKLLNAREFFARHDHCLFCAVLERELRDQTRIVIEDDAFVTYAPWASRVPYELRVMPRPHHASFLEVPQAQRRRLAAHLRSVLCRLDGLFGDVPYNWVLHTIPASEVDPRVFHWHIEILPRLAIQGGYEWGSGSFINSTAPEAAAVDLRAAE